MCGGFMQKMTWKEIHTLYRIPDRTTPVNPSGALQRVSNQLKRSAAERRHRRPSTM